MAIIEVDESDFASEMDSAFDRGDVVIVKFGSTYCDACMALGFELEELDDTRENLTILEVDCSTSEALAEEFDIIEVPTMKIYKQRDQVSFEGVGVILAEDIAKLLDY